MEKYSSLFYETRVAATVQADIAGLGRAPSRAETLSTIKRVTKELWEGEDVETREIILEALAEDRATKEKTKCAIKGEQTPADYQR